MPNAVSRITGRLSIKEVRSGKFLTFWVTVMSGSVFRKQKESYEWLGQVYTCMYIHVNNFFIFCNPRKIAVLSAVLRSRRFALQKLSMKIIPISVSEEAALCKFFHVSLDLY